MVRFLSLAILALSLACGGGHVSEDGDDSPGGKGPEGGDRYESAPALERLADDRVAALQADVEAVLAKPEVVDASVSLLIVDAETRQQLVAVNPELMLKPASNTKLFTTAAAIEVFGEDHRFATTITADAGPSGGVVAGDVVVTGGFDFTWSPYVLDRANLAIEELVEQLSTAGITEIQGTVWIAGEYLLDGYSLGTYDPGRESAEVAQALSEALGQAGIEFGAIDVEAGAGTKPTTLARFDSPPLAVGSTPLNRVSHNEFADLLARYLGTALGGEPGAWPEEASQWASSIGIDVSLHDGSGLSHDNRVSAAGVVSLLRFMVDRPEGQAWLRTLSIAGVDGTLGSRLTGADTVGRVWAKTGTLTGVIATSGVVFNAYDGRRYLFSILMNDTGSKAATRAAQDEIIGIIAGDLRNDIRPAAPTLTEVKRESDAVRLSWSAVNDASGYLVWLSTDGLSWKRSNARFVSETSYRSEPLADEVVHVRISAVGDRGESAASDAYAAGRGERRVLIVDGNDRWQAHPGFENPMGEAHLFGAQYGRDLEGRIGFDSVANEVVAASDVDLSDYEAVIWMVGEDGTEDRALDSDERDQVAAFLDDGGKLMISGAEIGWDLVANGSEEDRAFYSDYLRADFGGDDAETTRARSSGTVFEASNASLGFFTPAGLVVSYPDRLEAGNGAVAAFEYSGGQGGAAAIAYQGGHSLLYFGFPFEAIDNEPDRQWLLGQALDFFGL